METIPEAVEDLANTLAGYYGNTCLQSQNLGFETRHPATKCKYCKAAAVGSSFSSINFSSTVPVASAAAVTVAAAAEAGAEQKWKKAKDHTKIII